MSIYSRDFNAPSAEDEFLVAEARRELAHFAASLPPTLAQLFQLKKLEGLPSREVALVLGVDVHQVYRDTKLLDHRWEQAKARWG
ncbi:MAG: sigma factor-like helix-turn-helix DNA-binding protein [Spirochaetales bacterium]